MLSNQFDDDKNNKNGAEIEHKNKSNNLTKKNLMLLVLKVRVIDLI